MVAGVAISDARGRLLYCNPAFAALTGRDAGELEGVEPPYPFWPAEDAAGLLERWQSALRGAEAVHSTEMRICRPDGSCRDMLASAARIAAGSDTSGWVISVHDVTARNQATEALENLNAQMETVIERAGDIVVLVDRDCHVVYTSGARAFGLDPSALVGKTPIEIAPPEAHETADRLMQRARLVMETGERATFETRLDWQGKEMWFSHHVFPVRDREGNTVGAGQVSREITQDKRNRDRLADTGLFYESLLVGVQDGVWATDENDVIRFVNPALAEMAGMSEADLRGQRPLEEGCAPVFAALSAAYRQARATLQQARFRARPTVLRGRQSYLSGWMSPRVRDGRFDGMVCTTRDITEHRDADEQREQLLRRERALTRVGHTLVSEDDLDRVARMLVDQCLEITMASGVALWVMEPGRQGLRLVAHRGVPDEFLSDHRTIQVEVLSAMLDGNFLGPSELGDEAMTRHTMANPPADLGAYLGGQRKLVLVPLHIQQKLLGLITFLYPPGFEATADDTQVLRTLADLFAVGIQHSLLTRELREREQQVSLLLKTTIEAQEEERQRVCLDVHDGVAQSLASASNYLQALRGHSDVPTDLQLTVERASALVEQAIHEAREVISSLRPAALDVLGLVSTLRHELTELQAQAGLTIQFQAAGVRYPKSTETSLYRIIHEALNNIVKHAKASNVVVRLTEVDGQITVEVRDDGVGFDLLSVERSLRPVGMGLISMRKRVELLGGTFDLESQPGAGTRVLISVPVLVDVEHLSARGDDRPRQSGKSFRPELERITVLIVDDHELAREGLRAMLETDPQMAIVGDAEDAQQALSMVGQLRPKVVLLDIQLPDIDGIQATRLIKDIYPTTAVIMMTGYEDEALVVSAVQAGAAGYLPKGTSRELLGHTVRAVVSGGTLVGASLLRKAMDMVPKATKSRDSVEAPTDYEPLTDREMSVLRMLAEGRTNREIGDAMAFSETTVKRETQSIIAKLRSSDRTHAAITALRLGLIE